MTKGALRAAKLNNFDIRGVEVRTKRGLDWTRNGGHGWKRIDTQRQIMQQIRSLNFFLPGVGAFKRRVQHNRR